ncbi:hypothetical protein KKE45_00405 [Patescibacteria group bacterium]|nr:hypothetical protein [Patescibacteria group bacterium]
MKPTMAVLCKKIKREFVVVFSFFSLFLLTLLIPKHISRAAGLPAFPEAQGFGSQTIGGRGGRVIKVTNLNDSGSGSLREALETSGPRIVVFDVSGTIELSSKPIKIKNGYLTVAGQTAPGAGIQVVGGIRIDGRNDTVNNIILRYLRIRSDDYGCISGSESSGDCDSGSSDTLEFNGEINNVIIDHCSMSWATDENVSFYTDGDISKNMNNIIFQWNIFAEGDRDSTHPKSSDSWGSHSMGLLMGARSFDQLIGNISVHHNLFIHNDRRNPLISYGADPSTSSTQGVFRVINNVIYNWGSDASHMRAKHGGVIRVHYINNYYRYGPDSKNRNVISCNGISEEHYGICELYLSGNLFQDKLGALSTVEAHLTNYSGGNMRVMLLESTPSLNDSVNINSAEDALDKVTNHSGANLPPSSLLSRNQYTRDLVDERLINELKTATGKIGIDNDNVRRYPNIISAETPLDSDNDGMPNVWETTKGLNPNQDDSKQDRDSDGYTNIEEYINSLIDQNTQFPTSLPLSCTPPRHFGNALRANGACDNDINMSDYATWFREFFNNETTLYADFNQDNVVNRDDLPQWINKCYETGYGCTL